MPSNNEKLTYCYSSYEIIKYYLPTCYQFQTIDFIPTGWILFHHFPFSETRSRAKSKADFSMYILIRFNVIYPNASERKHIFTEHFVALHFQHMHFHLKCDSGGLCNHCGNANMK